MTFSIPKIFAATCLLVGLAMTSWSGWILLKPEAPRPQVELQQEGVRMCPPSLTELLPIQVPYRTAGMIIVFGIGLVVTARSARHFVPGFEGQED
jgi:hypothetical protein